MSIKRHLFFYNTISVFTALVVMLLVSGVTTHFTAENYRRPEYGIHGRDCYH